MFSALAVAVTLLIGLTQPGQIVTESELPPVGEQPAQSTQEPEQPMTKEPPAEVQAPEVSAEDAAEEAAVESEHVPESPKEGGPVMAFWMIAPSQANP